MRDQHYGAFSSKKLIKDAFFEEMTSHMHIQSREWIILTIETTDQTKIYGYRVLAFIIVIRYKEYDLRPCPHWWLLLWL